MYASTHVPVALHITTYTILLRIPGVACASTRILFVLLTTVQELSAEASGAQMLLTKDNLERALMARLMEPPDPYPQWPIAYLCVSSLSRVPWCRLC